MSDLVVYAPPQGQYEARLLANYDLVRRRFTEAKAPPPRPPVARPMSPFHPLRLEAERQRLNALWTGPPMAIYDLGPGMGLGVMLGVNPRKATSRRLFRQCEEIAKDVAHKHGINVLDISSARRHKESVSARYETFWRCRQETNLSLPQIGRCFGRDHTTVIHGIKQHQARIDAGEVL